MKKLKDLVKVVGNNETCVVLQVEPNAKLDLICLGYFEGDEEFIRLTKGYHLICTVFTTNNKYSWEWGTGATTCVTDSLKIQGQMIQDCIEKDFGITCQLKSRYY